MNVTHNTWGLVIVLEEPDLKAMHDNLATITATLGGANGAVATALVLSCDVLHEPEGSRVALEGDPATGKRCPVWRARSSQERKTKKTSTRRSGGATRKLKSSQ